MIVSWHVNYRSHNMMGVQYFLSWGCIEKNMLNIWNILWWLEDALHDDNATLIAE